MRLDVVPPVAPALADALIPALGVVEDECSPLDPWGRAALEEGVEPEEPAADYALLPRRTRGATRA